MTVRDAASWLALLPLLTAAVDVEVARDAKDPPATSFPEDVPRLVASVGSDAPETGVVVRWIALGPPERKLCEARIGLGKTRAVVPCAAPPGGFEPGDYRIDVAAAAGAALASATFRITAVGAPTAPRPEGRVNLAAASAGGRVRLATSQPHVSEWQVANLIDGLIDAPRADRTRSSGWIASSTKPQEVVVSFDRAREATVDGVVVDPRAHDGKLEAVPKLVEIWTSSAAHPTEGFTRAATARLPRDNVPQLVAFPATRARMVSVRILSTYGQPARLGEIEVLEAPGASILADFRPPGVPADDEPVAQPVEPETAAALASAVTVAAGGVTDVARKGLYKLEVKEPVVLHAGALGLPFGSLRVLDAEGGALVARKTINNRHTGWHGKVGAGAYYVQVDASGPVAKPTDDSTEAKLAAQPAVLVIQEPILARPTPFDAAQRGLDYLEVESNSWQNAQQCGGCHIQTETLLGMAKAKANGYRVDARAAIALGELLVAKKSRNDDDHELARQLGLRYYVESFAPGRAAAAAELAKELVASAPKDFVFRGVAKPPVEQGAVTETSMAIQVLAPLDRSGAVVAGGLAFLRAAPVKTVQDRVMRIMAYLDGGADRAALADEVAGLLVLQNPDGGFGERDGGGPSNAYGTGQALYALRSAGFPVADRRFARGVAWLMEHQQWNGAWPVGASVATSEIAATMWAVIGLAGSYDRNGAVANDHPLDVRLVPVRVVAQDAAGRTLNDLRPGDFDVREDGAAQTVVSVTRETGDFTIVLVMDTSGSIRAALPTMVKAATAFIGLLRPKDRIALISFSDEARAPQPFAVERQPVLRELGALAARGGTALYDAIGAALDALAPEPSPRAILLITDGRDENDRGNGPGSKASLAQTLARVAAADAPVYAIGLGKEVERHVLEQIAGASGGRAYFVNMPKELPKLYADLATALRSQYLVVYRSTRPADGKWRKIAVAVKRPGARVQATPAILATK